MSNFAFMNNHQIIDHSIAYKNLYDYAVLAEGSYHSNKVLFCIYSRFVLEQFCEFVVDYSDSRQFFSGTRDGVGWYWSKRNGNYERMIKIVHGDAQLRRMKTINSVSRSHLHSFGGTQADNRYAEVICDIFALLLWLYKSFLNQKTDLTIDDFDWNQVIESGRSYAHVPEVEVSTESLICKLQERLPGWDVNRACVAIQEDDYVILRDRYGNEVGRYYTKADYDIVQRSKEDIIKEKRKLETELVEKIEKYHWKIEKKESEIDALRQKINQIEDNLFSERQRNTELDTQKVKLLAELDDKKKERDGFEKALKNIQNGYDTQIQQLEAQLEELGAGYENAVEEIKHLIKEKEILSNTYHQKNKLLEEDICSIQQELFRAKKNADLYHSENQEAYELIEELEMQLIKKQKELEQQRRIVSEWVNTLNEEQRQLWEAYKAKKISLETLIMNLVIGNEKIKDGMTMMQGKDDKSYLQVIRRDVTRLNNSYALYVQNPDEVLLRSMLLKIRRMFEKEIQQRDEEISVWRKKWMEAEWLHSKELDKVRREAQEKIQKEKEENEKTRIQLDDERHKREKEQLENTILKKTFKELHLNGQKKWGSPIVLIIIISLLIVLVLLMWGVLFNIQKLQNMQSQETIQPSASSQSNENLPILQDGAAEEESYESMEQPSVNNELSQEELNESLAETQQEIEEEQSIEQNEEQNVEQSIEQYEEEKTPLDMFKEEQERVKALPKSLDEIPGINPELAAFVREKKYQEWFQTGYEGAEFLTEGYSRRVSSQREKYYTYDELPWLSFCTVYPQNPYPNSTVYYFTLEELTSELNSQSTLQDFVDLLGEPVMKLPTTESDFSFRKDLSNPYQVEWDYDDSYEDLRRMRLFVYVDDEGVFDYCNIYIGPK